MSYCVTRVEEIRDISTAATVVMSLLRGWVVVCSDAEIALGVRWSALLAA